MRKRLAKRNSGGFTVLGPRIPGPTVPGGKPSFHCPNCKRPAEQDVVCADCGYELVLPRRRKWRSTNA